MKALRVAAVLTVIGLAFMVWSLIQPTPMPVLLAMSVGQLFGTAAFAIYVFIVVRDVRRKWRKGERLIPWLKRFDHFTRSEDTE
jgi:hypothetical protein